MIFNILKNLILIGAGGHAKSCIDIIEFCNEYSIIGLLDPSYINKNINKNIYNYSLIGTDEMIPELLIDENHFLITIGQIKNYNIRKNLFKLLEENNASIATIISPSSYVSKHSVVSKGTIVMNGAKIGPSSIIGKNCIINTNANIEHDVIIGSNCHISTSSTINGGCKIGDNVFIGSGTTINNGIEIVDNTIIASGSLINKSVLKQGIIAGNPGKRIF